MFVGKNRVSFLFLGPIFPFFLRRFTRHKNNISLSQKLQEGEGVTRSPPLSLERGGGGCLDTLPPPCVPVKPCTQLFTSTQIHTHPTTNSDPDPLPCLTTKYRPRNTHTPTQLHTKHPCKTKVPKLHTLRGILGSRLCLSNRLGGGVRCNVIPTLASCTWHPTSTMMGQKMTTPQDGDSLSMSLCQVGLEHPTCLLAPPCPRGG